MRNWLPLAAATGVPALPIQRPSAPAGPAAQPGVAAPAAGGKPGAVGKAGAPGAAGAKQAAGGPASGPGAGANPFGGPMFWVLMLGVLVLFVFMSRGKSKDEKKRKAMLNALAKGDRVLTIGGLYGSVVDIRDDEVVLKVDESNNVKMHYAKSAIQRVLMDKTADTVK